MKVCKKALLALLQRFVYFAFLCIVILQGRKIWASQPKSDSYTPSSDLAAITADTPVFLCDSQDMVATGDNAILVAGHSSHSSHASHASHVSSSVSTTTTTTTTTIPPYSSTPSPAVATTPVVENRPTRSFSTNAFEATVTRIIDGDTVIVTDSKGVHAGMSRQDVIALLGAPIGTMPNGAKETLLYSNGAVKLEDGKVSSFSTPPTDGSDMKVRLLGIDAPEIGQKSGSLARMALSDKVFKKQVTVVPVKQDANGVALATIRRSDGQNVSLEMVKEGWAWCCKDDVKSTELAAAQDAARKARIGLWADAGPLLPPWDYRAAQGN